MNQQQYTEYQYYGMNQGFAPFLPYTASNGIKFSPTYCLYPNQKTMLYFATRHGVIHPDCGVNWGEAEDSPKRFTMGAKYGPLGTNRHGSCYFDSYGTEALEEIAKMVADVHRAIAQDLIGDLKP